MSIYHIVLSTNESTVVTEYEPQSKRSDAYQSEAALEVDKMFIIPMYSLPIFADS